MSSEALTYTRLVVIIMTVIGTVKEAVVLAPSSCQPGSYAYHLN